MIYQKKKSEKINNMPTHNQEFKKSFGTNSPDKFAKPLPFNPRNINNRVSKREEPLGHALKSMMQQPGNDSFNFNDAKREQTQLTGSKAKTNKSVTFQEDNDSEDIGNNSPGNVVREDFVQRPQQELEIVVN